MKKCIALLVIIACLFSGCYGQEGSWEPQYNVDRVTEIKLVDMDTEWNYTVLKELDITCASEIYSEINKLSWKRYGPNLATPRGVCFLIMFDSGEYDVISYHEPKHYRFEDGIVQPFNSWICCDQEAFEAIVSKYQ